MVHSTFGEWLREKRKEAGLTIAEAAAKLTPPAKEAAWRHIEVESKYVPKKDTIIRYATAIGGDVKEALTIGGYDPGMDYGVQLPMRQVAMYASLSDEAKEIVHDFIGIIWSRDKKRPLFGSK